MDKDVMLFQLKLKALELAALDMIQEKGLVNTPALYKKAKRIYEGGLEADILNWTSLWEKTTQTTIKTPKPKVEAPPTITGKSGFPVPNPEFKPPQDDNKKCPACGESVPKSWAKHMFKKDGKLCGHIF